MAQIIVSTVIGLVIGFTVGSVFMRLRHHAPTIGKLRMDDSTGDTYLFLELNVPVEYALRNKNCLLDIDLTPITRE